MQTNSSQNAIPPVSPHVLLTGASGVIGGAVLSELHDLSVTVLTHQQPAVSTHTRFDVVTGSLGEPRLGLGRSAYESLAAEIDCVINCAGVSHAGSVLDQLRAANVDGTRNVLDFCEASGASLVHVSTAAEENPATADREIDAESPFSVAPYLRSKREADRLVRESGVDAAIAKPSQVVGDSQTGVTPRFQGVHKLSQLLLMDGIGVLPMDPDSRADFLPRDIVARAIVALARRADPAGEWWLTAGPFALTMERVVELMCGYAESIGHVPPSVRFIAPEAIDRLVRPALLPELPRKARVRFEYAIEFSRLIQPREGDCSYTYSTSIPELLGDDALTSLELEAAVRSSLDYWAPRVGLAGAESEIAS